MITEDLIAYIQSQTKKNTPKDMIVAHLAKAGWRSEDIAEGFAMLAPAVVSASLPVSAPAASPVIPPVVEQPIAFKPVAVTEEPKIWVPMTVKPLVPEIQAPELQSPVAVVVPAEVKIRPVVDSIRIPPKPPQILPVQPPAPLMPSLSKTPIVSPAPAPVAVSIPPSQPIVMAPKKEPLTSSVSSILGQQASMTSPAVHGSGDDAFSKRAMISSFKQDSISANQSYAHSSRLNAKTVKRITVGALVLVFLGVFGFAFAKGYIKTPNFALSIVKKDPGSALMVAAANFGALKSYKSDISASLTAPSFAAITTGLVSGDPEPTTDLESVSVTAHGQVTNATAMTPALYDYTGALTSSLLMNEITSSWKYDGTTSYIDVPDLSELFGTNAPPPATVAVANGQFGLVLPELSQNIQDMVKTADVYDIVSKGIPAYAQSQVASAFSDFIGNVTVTEKPDETIDGVSTYHYSLEASRDVTKKFLTDVFNVFAIPLSDNMKQNVDQALGAATLQSFDVWVGKDDSMVHQYQFTLTAPLSQVIALNDQGIAGKEVTFTFEDTFSDFDVPNAIQMPTSSVSMPDFVKSIQDTKIKSIVSSFPTAARNLANAEGGYGKKSTVGGSCTNPVSGSLFSPTGHSNGASGQVGLIASTMTGLLAETNNAGSCDSTPSGWAMAVPLASDPTSYYCADSTGALVTTSVPLDGTTCK